MKLKSLVSSSLVSLALTGCAMKEGKVSGKRFEPMQVRVMMVGYYPIPIIIPERHYLILENLDEKKEEMKNRQYLVSKKSHDSTARDDWFIGASSRQEYEYFRAFSESITHPEGTKIPIGK